MKKFFRPVRVPLVLAATLIFCVTIHEIGHVIATLATGGRVKSFSVLSLQPHVRVQGKFTDAQNAVKSVAGSGTFLAAWVGFALVLPRGFTGFLEVQATAAFFAFIEVLGWTLSCLIYPRGPKSNDSWKFIDATGADPLTVVAVCIALMGVIALLYRRRFHPSIPRKSYPQGVSILTANGSDGCRALAKRFEFRRPLNDLAE